MNLKEQHIIDSLVSEALDADELSALKNNLAYEENYENFLSKLLSIIISKDKTVSLFDFLKFNNLSSKFLFFQNKTSDIIEDLAELSFKGYESETIAFLLQTNNEVFYNHIQFLKETQNAIIFSERISLKKKLEKLDELNGFDLGEKEIKAAITLSERNRLKKHLTELSKKGNNDEGTIIKFDFRQVLKYAAILILVVAPTIIIVNRVNKQKTTTNDLANNDNKKQTEPKQIEKEPYNFQLQNADTYAMEKELLQEQKFGFSSGSDSKNITIKINNLSVQLTGLENEIEKHKDDLKIKNYLIQKIDSISALKDTYIFDKINGLAIYTLKLSPTKNTLQQLKLITTEKEKLYLKEKSAYYLIKKDGLRHQLIKETSEDIIDQLDLIENQNN
jgi:hypothetical protein